MRWVYDTVAGAWTEQSNIYTDSSTASSSATAVMVVNDAVTSDIFTYSGRLTAGDDDGFGLIFGYQDAVSFYRVTFSRQSNAARGSGQFPGVGWKVDRKVDDVTTTLFGSGTAAGAILFTNRANVPFDVTITVEAGNLFSLTVVEDPAGAPVTHPLVVSQPLPGSAAGQVGIYSWGMNGSYPDSFRISNLSLSPESLVNNPPNPLPDWASVLPPRANGTADLGTTGNRQGMWGLALGETGPYGTLNETGDTFGGNDAAGQLDFVAPTLVAGDAGWANYVLSTRIVSPDDDGAGVLLRYQNDTTYYRIAFRSQSSGTGIRRGLSVQKAVGGVFEEIYFESPVTGFVPVANVPFDVLAAIHGNQLQIIVINDPNGARNPYAYGPLDMAGVNGLTSDQGKVGVFSWAMSLVQFDFVRVESVSGVPLLVSSPFGPADPPAGLNDYPPGTEVTASVPATVEDQPGVRHVATSFTGFGSVPSSGSGNSVTFTLNALSAINWEWQTEYRLVAAAETGGTVVAPPSEWQLEGASVTLTAQPGPGYVFGGWSGDSLSVNPSLSFSMTRPVTVTARFLADSDGDGLPDSFEMAYFNDLAEVGSGDPDNDLRTNAEEYEWGTDPTFAETLVASDGLSSPFENAQRDPILPGQFVVQDFGMGFRGAWDVSNDYRAADDPTIIGSTSVVANVSFDGPRLVIRDEVWNPAWADVFTAQVVFTVGDNDGNCVYWRYQNESHWYRVTICGELNDAAWRARLGVTVQKRVGNVFTELTSNAGILTDPWDGTNPDPSAPAGWKRVRVTIASIGDTHQVIVEGWDAFATQDWSPGSAVLLSFTDSDLLTGRLAVGHWGQNGDPAPPTAQIPVDDGVLIEEVRIEVENVTVFHEDWSTAPLPGEFPTGWTNPYVGVVGQEGDWRMSAHGTIFQMSNFAPGTSGTDADPKADADGLILLAPDPGVANYQLELGFHPFDDDGIGFVYDFQDPDNFARVLFVSEASGATRVPQGLNISRKRGGVWSDIIVEDLNFIYQPGHPFGIRFANNNGEYRLSAWNLDGPATTYGWTWTDQRAAADNRFGLTTWGEQDGHFLYARALSLPDRVQPELRITGIRVDGGGVTLDVSNTTGQPYEVWVTTSLSPASWALAVGGQTGSQWTGPVPPGADMAFYQLVRP
jgi:uncharacterized repeat protein (TIGR02543 family)